MKVNVDTVLNDFLGKPIKSVDEAGKQTDLTLKDVCINALLTEKVRQGVEPIVGTEKLTRFNLARKISKGGDVEISAADSAKIQKLIEVNYAAMVYGLCHELLEGKTE